jgi:tRNA nucleotidyltransferase (CCA-adding enzyme)
MVEMLQEAGLELSAAEASLLLLGIHEDTGSFGYDTSTARDVRAVAWLMDQGASVSVLRRFLDIQLSEQQQALFDLLHRSLEWVHTEGQSIALAAVIAPAGFEDEVSAVAHRLREAISPDCMILMVQLKPSYVQLVARSNSDAIDVSVLARRFGGGGHSRAAAATIMDIPLEAVRASVMEGLAAAIRPITRVSEIMSHGVQTVLTTTPVSLAAEQMRRFGHEGYPVLSAENGTLVGLLTRRMVDRATSHQLGHLPVSRVMRAGEVTVRPSDSVDLVQRLMIQEGWGQIPVISEEPTPGDSRLIGIVTRTDLINLMNANAGPGQSSDMRQLMETHLPAGLWDLVETVGRVARDMEMPLYLVGGVVRDLILRKPATDIDIVVEGDAIALVRRLRRLFGGEARSHSKFGTAKWLTPPAVWGKLTTSTAPEGLPEAVDFVTARTEFYTLPSALPEVERGSIKLDLHRRDFTINTLAIRLDGAHLGELLDFYGGRRDLEQGLIRVLHSLSFVDDPTRILRAARLEQRLGFQIEARTAELISHALPNLDQVTGDRIRHELELCLQEPSRIAILERLGDLGVWAQIHPGLTWPRAAAELLRRAQALLNEPPWAAEFSSQSAIFAYFALWLLSFPAAVQREVMERLRVRKTTSEDLFSCDQLVREIAAWPAAPRPSEVVRALRFYRPRVLFTVLVALGAESEKGELITLYQREWHKVRPVLTGDDLLSMGLEPGPAIGRLLDTLLTARLDGEVTDEAGELALVARILSESGLPARA